MALTTIALFLSVTADDEPSGGKTSRSGTGFLFLPFINDVPSFAMLIVARLGRFVSNQLTVTAQRRDDLRSQSPV
ncbi:MAG TPA: hypothetical protein VGT61_08785 [Thermomicrobiales bacterium]|nr:hypothetical protein [Thermomicrobiales bacterium]